MYKASKPYFTIKTGAFFYKFKLYGQFFPAWIKYKR